MVFTSLKFVVFFAIIFAGYYLLPAKKRWVWLLAGSYYFYMSASAKYVVYLLFTTIVTYLGATAMDDINHKQAAYLAEHKKDLSRDEKKAYKAANEKGKKRILFVILFLVLLQLGVLKYAGFVLDNVNALMGVFRLPFSARTVSFILPIGLSFYTFQSLGYCLDVYWETYDAERNFFKHALYVSYFAQILEGPIGTYESLGPQLFAEHEFDYERTVRGFGRVVWGFFKKRVLADHISAIITGVVWFPPEFESLMPGLMTIMCVILFAIQLYADFSGYTDMAIGCSEMLGIKLDENFDNPYFSQDIAEYWRRWHITLGKWFRTYVFYPILRSKTVEKIRKHYKTAGNKYLVNALPNVVALLALWSLTGLWHGADWSYVVYGLFHGSIIIFSVLMEPRYNAFHAKHPGLKDKTWYKGFRMVRTFALVCIGYSFFWPAHLPSTLKLWKYAVSGLNPEGFISFVKMYPWQFKCIAYSTLVVLIHDVLSEKMDLTGKLRSLPTVARWAMYAVFITVTAYTLSYGASEAFLYFQF